MSRPSQHIYRRSPLGATYDAFDSERYVLTFENKAFRDIAANAPYDVVEILVNSATYGGGGIFGLYSTVAADSAWAPYVFVHEFGHHIAGTRRRVLHVGRRLSPRRRPRRALGAERDRAARSRLAEVEGSRRARHADSDAVAEGRVRTLHEGDSAAAPGDPRREPARVRDGRALSRRAAAGHGHAEQGAARRQGRRVRRRELRGARLLSGRRPTASCSRATTSRSAPSAAGRSTQIIDLYSRP